MIDYLDGMSSACCIIYIPLFHTFSVLQLSSYDVEMKFDIISYASEPKDIIKVLDPFSDNTDVVLRKLELFTQTSMSLMLLNCHFQAAICKSINRIFLLHRSWGKDWYQSF